jgi:hypothetical protein
VAVPQIGLFRLGTILASGRRTMRDGALTIFLGFACGCGAVGSPQHDLEVAGDLATPSPDLAELARADLATADSSTRSDASAPFDLRSTSDLAVDDGPWSAVMGGNANSIAISPMSGETPFNIYVGLGGWMVAHSTDGTSWTLGGPQGVVALAPFPVASVCWAALSDGTVQLTANGGVDWETTAARPPFPIVSMIAIAGIGPFGGGASGDSAVVVNGVSRGAAWNASAPFGKGVARSLVHAGTAPTGEVILAAVNGSAGGVFRSSDSGATFFPTTFPQSDALSVAAAPSSPSTVFAGSNGKGLYRSLDGGTTWTAASGLDDARVNAIVVDPLDASVVYAGTASGVHRSSDGGATFRLSGLARTSISTLTIQNGSPSTIYAVTSLGLFVTKTGGL